MTATDHSGPPRLPPLAAADLDDAQRALLAASGSPLNIFRTLVRHPGLFRKWLPFGGKLLAGGKLSARDRELVILRTAFRCRGAYEWAQHVGIARTAGLADDEIARVAAGPDASGWSSDDAALLRAVDELHDDHGIGDATWSALAARYTTEQLIELPMLSGHYAMLAGVLNSLRVPLDSDDLPPLGELRRG